MTLKHQAGLDRKLLRAIRRTRSHLPAHLPGLIFLTDPQRTPDPVRTAARLPAGCGVIFRHFGADDRFERAQALANLAKRRGLCLLIAADPALARTVGADGVHWPEARLGEARHWRTAFALQTASAHSRRAIHRAMQAGLDGALVSSIFASRSPSAGHPIGPARLARLAAGTKLPLYGLGGVNTCNAGQIAGFAGLAAIDGIETGSGDYAPLKAD